MAVCRFLIDNVWVTAAGALSATSEASALLATSTQNKDRTNVWRSLSQTADQALTRDLGEAMAVDNVAVANVRRLNGGDLKLYEGGSGASAGSWNLVATLPDQDEDTRLAVSSFAATTARHWKLEWTNAEPSTADYAECGYVGLGEAFEPSRACVVPVQWEPNDPSIGRSSVDGQTSFTTRTGYSSGSLVFRALSEGDLTSFRALYRGFGRRAPFFFSLDTDLGNQQWLMRFAGELTVKRRHVPGRYDLSFNWLEHL